eukprot:888872-Prymnesium_polylepis.1
MRSSARSRSRAAAPDDNSAPHSTTVADNAPSSSATSAKPPDEVPTSRSVAPEALAPSASSAARRWVLSGVSSLSVSCTWSTAS